MNGALYVSGVERHLVNDDDMAFGSCHILNSRGSSIIPPSKQKSDDCLLGYFIFLQSRINPNDIMIAVK